jgi:hypothetical protein
LMVAGARVDLSLIRHVNDVGVTVLTRNGVLEILAVK